MYIFVTVLVVSSKRSVTCLFPRYRISLSADESMETNSGIKYISKTDKHTHVFFQWHCCEKKN